MRININMIPSKSQAHRAYICNALACGGAEIICRETSEDIEATKNCLTAMETAERQGGPCILECGESGSTLRFLLPVAGALGIQGSFMPRGRLPQRPLSPLYEELVSHGMSMSPQGTVPFEVKGKLTAGDYVLPGNISSQFISGLLFALPILQANSTIHITGARESTSYIEMTLDMLRKFGIEIEVRNNEYHIKGNQRYKAPETLEIEGDWSNAAFWIVAGAISNDGILANGISINNLNNQSVQGDRMITSITEAFGADIIYQDNGVAVKKSRLSGQVIDAADIPDLVPPIALMAAVSSGTTTIYNAGRLRIKESDRLLSVKNALNSLGGDVTDTADGLIIHGKKRLAGGECDSCGDHRIAMMSAMAGLVSDNPVIIKNSKAVAKSYPGFFRELASLGSAVKVIAK